MITQWGVQSAQIEFQEWWESQPNDYDRAKGIDLVDLKPEIGDFQTFIKATKAYIGDHFTLFLKARANFLGLKCDATMRAKDKMKNSSKYCEKCKGKKEETLSHVMLVCEGHARARSPLIGIINSLPKAEQTRLGKLNSKGQLLNHILGGDTPTVTKVAMECLNEMMKDRTRQT